MREEMRTKMGTGVGIGMGAGMENGMKEERKSGMGNGIKNGMKEMAGRTKRFMMKKDAGIDGILVTVGLCIIALVLCAFMRDSLAGFIKTVVQAMTSKATGILGESINLPGV